MLWIGLSCKRRISLFPYSLTLKLVQLLALNEFPHKYDMGLHNLSASLPRIYSLHVQQVPGNGVSLLSVGVHQERNTTSFSESCNSNSKNVLVFKQHGLLSLKIWHTGLFVWTLLQCFVSPKHCCKYFQILINSKHTVRKWAPLLLAVDAGDLDMRCRAKLWSFQVADHTGRSASLPASMLLIQASQCSTIEMFRTPLLGFCKWKAF